ncbi:MAG: DUF4832 domain-containing protein [Spirochaetes bacterium]|nr:DUF4832 domain-containing protein [Spirochaetota bacterium]
MIKDLAARYDNDPRIYAFELGIIGYWGESHTFGTYTNDVAIVVSSNAMYQVVTAYKTYFKKAMIMARYPGWPAYANAGGIGFYNDSFGYDLKGFEPYLSQGLFWRNGPIGGEVRPESFLEDGFYAPTNSSYLGLELIKSGHYATMKAGGYQQQPGDPFYSKFRELNKRMGYNYQISEALFCNSNVTGVPFTVSVKGTNVGVAPLYYDWNVEFALLDGSNKPKTTALAPVSLKRIMENDEFQFSASLPVDIALPGGSYKLGLRIIQPGAAAAKGTAWKLYSSNVAIQFANTFSLGYVNPSWTSSNSLDGGWSILGNVTIVSNTAKSIVTGFPAGFVTNKSFAINADVTGNYGYIATTPAGPYSSFTTIGTNITVTATTTYYYYGCDTLGNSSETNTVTYTIDNAAPVISGFPASFTTNAAFFINADVNENRGYFSEGGGYAFSAFSTNGTNILVDSTTTFFYYAIDDAGNCSGTNTVTYTFDTKSPTVSGFPLNCWTNTFTINADVDENYGYYSTNSSTGPFIQLSTNGASILVSKTGNIWYYGADDFGNTSAVITRWYGIDNTPPVITGFLSSRSTNTSFGLSLDVNEQLGYFSTNAAGPFWTITTNGTNVTVTGTTIFWYFGRDVYGNTSTTNSVTYTFGGGSRTPVVSGFPANFTTNVSFVLNLDVDMNYGYVATNVAGPYSPFTTSGTNITVSNTTSFWYYGYDALSNSSATNSRTYTFDITAPAVSGAPASFTTNDAFTVTLGVNENYGYWSTNGWATSNQFGTSGASIYIQQTTTLACFGRDALGNTGATNVFTYTLTPSPMLTIWLPCSENTGTRAYDSTANHNDALLSNGTGWTNGIGSGAGSALMFDGIDDNAFIPRSSTLDAVGQTNGDFAWAMFIKLRAGAAGSVRTVLKKSVNYNERTVQLSMNDIDDRLRVRMSTLANTNVGFTSRAALPLNTWTHLACVKSNNVLSLYLNGALDSKMILASATFSNTGCIWLGDDPWAAPTAMALDDLRLYSRPLASNEVYAIASAGGAGTTTPLAPYLGAVLTSANAKAEAAAVALTYTTTQPLPSAPTAAAAACLTAAFDDGSEPPTPADENSIAFAYAPAGGSSWTPIAVTDLDGVRVSNGAYVSHWKLPSGFDRTQKYDVKVSSVFAGEVTETVTIRNIDLAALFTEQTDLNKACVLNNPYTGTGEIGFMNLPAKATVRIYTVSGRLAAELSMAIDGATYWNASGADGKRVLPGVYLARINSPAGSRLVKVMVVR